MPQITWADVETVKRADLEGITTGYTHSQIEYWLDRAKRKILEAVSLAVLQERIDAGTVEKSAPGDVQVDLVLGKLNNPGGIRTVQETNGPASGSVTYGGDSPGQLTLTGDHRRALGVPVRVSRVAGTVPTWG